MLCLSKMKLFLGDFIVMSEAVKNEGIGDLVECGDLNDLFEPLILRSLEVSRFHACFVVRSCFHRAFSNETNTQLLPTP